ncbi:hypothetical protein K469DRAFT_699275 [Zopfia rhizophila CBS 207.26]|uniref:RNA polymerase II transcription factor SIII subunit A n=1 Tax=Zopfia rhizophila CBS 207.26 TaxID=1314779 RepID=A0A6A6EXZ9_9PEZI|nr:hypothetical protein K469DRAFT_699275 [Zopfia rhizophila CBS 207.26]
MPAPSLYDIAKTRILQNIHMLTDIGDLPYTFLRPILLKLQNPAQLAELETNCPQIVGETGEIWLKFIKRDIPNWDKKPHQPRDERNWGKVYRKLKRDAEMEKEKQEEELRNAMRALQKDRQENTTTIVNARVGYDPAARRKNFGSRGGVGWGSSGQPAKTGRAALDKLKRSMFDQRQARPPATQIPAHILEERKGKVITAPERMIRMNENESTKMLVPRRASISAAPSSSTSTTHNPQSANRTVSRPQPQQSPEKVGRTSLPMDRQFNAPKIQREGISAVPGVKRKRDDVNPFMPKKRRV